MKIFKLISALLLSMCALIFVVSCSGDAMDITKNYVVVYNHQSNSDAHIKSMLDERFTEMGASVEYSSDSAASFENEIILGDADFKSETEAIRTELLANTSEYIAAYSIARVGNDVIIAATSTEAETLAVEELFSLAEGKKLIVPADYKKTVYFNLYEYKKNGELIIYGDSISAVTDIEKIEVYGDTVIEIEKGKTAYSVPSDALIPLPTEEEISVTPYHSGITYEVSYAGRTVTVKVIAIDGTTSREYKINFSVDAEYSVSAEIVNKNGAKGVLTLISDDGDPRTADFFYTKIATKYDSFKLSIALPTREVANLKWTKDGKAWLKDDNGNYVLEIMKNYYTSAFTESVFAVRGAFETKVDFWSEIASTGQIEILSHSHSHSAWGQSDEIAYNSNGTVKYPEGNVIKEIHASAQILSQLLGQETSFICRPGGSADMTSEYFFNLVETDDTFLGMRTSNGAPPLVGESDNKLNKPEDFTTAYGRLRIATILVKGNEAALNESGTAFAMEDGARVPLCLEAGVSAWTRYIDLAMENGQWASIGFHGVLADNATKYASGYNVFDTQVIQLMEHVQPLAESGDLWVASFTEAAKYYFEWSGAEVSAKAYGSERVEVTLTDKEDDPRFNEPLTVKVTVPGDWTKAELDSYGEKTVIDVHVAEDGTRFVYANILPGDEVSTLCAAQ